MTPNTTPITKLPDGSGCFTATILSPEEVAALPIKKRPLNARISSEVYHSVFEKIGSASMQWSPRPTGVFDSSGASNIACELCFLIANEIEKAKHESFIAAVRIIEKEIDHCAAPVSHADLAAAKKAIMDEATKFE